MSDVSDIEVSAVKVEEVSDAKVAPPLPQFDPAWKFDFGLLKRRERTGYYEEIRAAIAGSKTAQTDEESEKYDAMAYKWMRKLIVGFPEGCDLRDEEVYKDLSTLKWTEALAAFFSQFRDAFDPERKGR